MFVSFCFSFNFFSLFTLLSALSTAFSNCNCPHKPKITGLRNLLGKLKAKQIDKGSSLNDNECVKILSTAAKQLKDSIKQYSDANRLDLVEKEAYELSLVENYLPDPISEDTVKKEVLIIMVNNCLII